MNIVVVLLREAGGRLQPPTPSGTVGDWEAQEELGRGSIISIKKKKSIVG